MTDAPWRQRVLEELRERFHRLNFERVGWPYEPRFGRLDPKWTAYSGSPSYHHFAADPRPRAWAVARERLRDLGGADLPGVSPGPLTTGLDRAAAKLRALRPAPPPAGGRAIAGVDLGFGESYTAEVFGRYVGGVLHVDRVVCR